MSISCEHQKRNENEEVDSLNPPVSINVRPATQADLPRILEMERAAGTAAHWAEADYERALAEPSPRRLLFVAESAGVAQQFLVQGFLVARSVHTSEWEIENVVVVETARRLGLGAGLLKAFIECVRAEQPPRRGVHAIFLEVRESNVAARKLYEKSGFVIERRREAYYSHPEESAILYHLLFQ